ncbi:hypothetical protein [Legionella tunisiensis]|nr:hypothetical protein [Legionella tunisiensis]
MAYQVYSVAVLGLKKPITTEEDYGGGGLGAGSGGPGGVGGVGR